LIQDQGQTSNLDSKIYLPGFHRFKFEFHSFFAETFSTASTHSGHRGTEIPRCSGLLPAVLSSGMLLDLCQRRLERAIGWQLHRADKWRDKVDVRRIQPLSRRDATAHAHVRLLRQSYAVRCAWLRGRCIGGICLVACCGRGEFLAQSGRNHRGLKRGCCIVRGYHCPRGAGGGRGGLSTTFGFCGHHLRKVALSVSEGNAC